MSHYLKSLEGCLQYIDETGKPAKNNHPPVHGGFGNNANTDGTSSSNSAQASQLLFGLNSEQLIAFYRTLVLIRLFDTKAVALQRTGRLGTYPSCLGQEAFSAGIGHALKPDDVFVPYYRDQATQYLRGVPLSQLLQLWGGDERANIFEGSAHRDLPICVPIATQITHAAGVASAMKVRSEHNAVLTTCGDGATSRGDFYESLNLAGVWQLPLVVVVNNNQWAISVPNYMQTASSSIADKGLATGARSLRVDGNDVLAVYHACQGALARARQGKGATLIECVTYRLCDHTTADDASRYRATEDLHEAWNYEPIKRLQSFLSDQGIWNAEKETALIASCEQEIAHAVHDYLNLPAQQPSDIVDFVFEHLPEELQSQRKAIIAKSKTMEVPHE